MTAHPGLGIRLCTTIKKYFCYLHLISLGCYVQWCVSILQNMHKHMQHLPLTINHMFLPHTLTGVVVIVVVVVAVVVKFNQPITWMLKNSIKTFQNAIKIQHKKLLQSFYTTTNLWQTKSNTTKNSFSCLPRHQARKPSSLLPLTPQH